MTTEAPTLTPAQLYALDRLLFVCRKERDGAATFDWQRRLLIKAKFSKWNQCVEFGVGEQAMLVLMACGR